MQEGRRAVTGWQRGRGDVLVNDAGIPHAAPVAGKARSAGPETADPALARTGGRRKLGLRVALTGLVVVTVAITALLIHLTWSYTAQRNVRDVAGQLNAQIIEQVRHELRQTLDNAWAVQEALRSIFFQQAIKPEDEAKREFVFLALLQSQPSLSWVSFGFPNGSFFGAQKASDGKINMVEVSWDAVHKAATLRVDHYHPEAGGTTHFDKRDGPALRRFQAEWAIRHGPKYAAYNHEFGRSNSREDSDNMMEHRRDLIKKNRGR